MQVKDEKPISKDTILAEITKKSNKQEPEWTKAELASLIFQVYNLGETDWKQIQVENPSGAGQSKKSTQ